MEAAVFETEPEASCVWTHRCHISAEERPESLSVLIHDLDKFEVHSHLKTWI
jgi:hypothetical protein